jgi:hypothetical protein
MGENRDENPTYTRKMRQIQDSQLLHPQESLNHHHKSIYTSRKGIIEGQGSSSAFSTKEILLLVVRRVPIALPELPVLATQRAVTSRKLTSVCDTTADLWPALPTSRRIHNKCLMGANGVGSFEPYIWMGFRTHLMIRRSHAITLDDDQSTSEIDRWL